jgi:hypothetical protein
MIFCTKEVKGYELQLYKPYFFVYFESNSKIPEIRSYIYVGENLREEKVSFEGDEYFFQDLASYTEKGIFIHFTDRTEHDVLVFDEPGLCAMEDIDTLIEHLAYVKTTLDRGRTS